MDSLKQVADSCFARQDNSLRIPETLPNSDDQHTHWFFIKIQFNSTRTDDCDGKQAEEEQDDEKAQQYEHEEEEEDEQVEEEHETEYVEIGPDSDTAFLTFWQPCPRVDRDNLPINVISSMLSEAGVPSHKQERARMTHNIRDAADRAANAAHNKDRKVLPMLVTVLAVGCSCMRGWVRELRLRRNIKKVRVLGINNNNYPDRVDPKQMGKKLVRAFTMWCLWFAFCGFFKRLVHRLCFGLLVLFIRKVIITSD